MLAGHIHNESFNWFRAYQGSDDPAIFRDQIGSGSSSKKKSEDQIGSGSSKKIFLVDRIRSGSSKKKKF